MEIDTVEILGLIAAVLTTSGFMPQIIKTWRTKDVSSLSLPMYLVLCLGMILWLIYGILTKSLALVVANTVSSSLTFLLVIFIFKFRK